MLALCLILSVIHYAQNYTGIIGESLIEWQHAFTYVTGFEKRRLPRTQQHDTLFTIKR